MILRITKKKLFRCVLETTREITSGALCMADMKGHVSLLPIYTYSLTAETLIDKRGVILDAEFDSGLKFGIYFLTPKPPSFLDKKMTPIRSFFYILNG